MGARVVWDHEVAGSIPVTPTTCGCNSMVEFQPSKLVTRVRFPSPAPFISLVRYKFVSSKQYEETRSEQRSLGKLNEQRSDAVDEVMRR